MNNNSYKISIKEYKSWREEALYYITIEDKNQHWTYEFDKIANIFQINKDEVLAKYNYVEFVGMTMFKNKNECKEIIEDVLEPTLLLLKLEDNLI